MKTFKLCSLAVLFDEDQKHGATDRGKEIPLVDGLIINKEEAQKDWLLDAVITPEWKPFFEEFQRNDQHFMAEVTITKKTNDPATLVCNVKAINDLHDNVSIHLDGILVVKNDDLSDMLLKNLIKEGYKGDNLFEEFKRRKKDRGQAIQGILSNVYNQVKQKGYYDSESS
ncbi:YwpF-like family protein [Bacillus tamaricis]|uniref:YwpF-like family protein n=1 Tax=Evansella tamaricis TaxID=2069301 RepID=A0ABS6JMA7_9BACI|nr:YwpF-like family protein [Evansella tamaricis]MBU9714812.1 YwpF-like family protein [Evansella tamaricis]